MSSIIYKYPISHFDIGIPFYLDLNGGAQILCVQIQNGIPMVWVRLDSAKPLEARKFIVWRTGEKMLDEYDAAVYIGTWQEKNILGRRFCLASI
jgi:hypothetical protein